MSSVATHARGLGRIPALDARDQRYSAGNLLRVAPAPVKDKGYATGPILDQGSTPRCVGFSIAGVIGGGPIMQLAAERGPVIAGELYTRAQQLDEWPGEAYDGTSVRAGFKAAVEVGWFASYVWAWDLATSVRYFREVGPGVDGITWYEGMFTPRRVGRDYWVEPTGSIAGGHAIRRVRYSVKRKATQWANSWGEGYGDKGKVWVHDDALSDLLRWGGEFCAGTEVRLPHPQAIQQPG